MSSRGAAHRRRQHFSGFYAMRSGAGNAMSGTRPASDPLLGAIAAARAWLLSSSLICNRCAAPLTGRRKAARAELRASGLQTSSGAKGGGGP